MHVTKSALFTRSID